MRYPHLDNLYEINRLYTFTVKQFTVVVSNIKVSHFTFDVLKAVIRDLLICITALQQ